MMPGTEAEAEVKLLGMWASPFVIRAKIALKLKKVHYDQIEETVRNKSPLLVESNPVYKKIPVLLHNGKAVCESMIIVEYVDEVWHDAGPAILPTDAFDSSVARFWAFYVDDQVSRLLAEYQWGPCLLRILRAETEEAKAEAAKEAKTCLQSLEKALEQCSKGKNFFGGDEIGYLDIALGSNLGWIKAAEEYAGVKLMQDTGTPLLAAWAERFCAHDAVKEVMPETQKLVEFGDRLRAWEKEKEAKGNVASTS